MLCDVYVLNVCSDNTRNGKIYEIEKQSINGVETLNIYYQRVNHSLPIFASIVKFFRYLNAHRIGYNYILKNFDKPQRIHLNIAFPAGIIALLLKYFYGLRYVVSESWSAYLDINLNKLSTLKKFISRAVFNNADCILPVTKNLQQSIKQLTSNKNFEIVPNVVDISVFNVENEQMKKEKKRVLHISTLDENAKNIFGLLRTIKELSESRKDFELLIISDGDPSAHIQLAKELLILNKFVFFEGAKSSQQIAETMKQFDFFVLFSNYESLPCVIVEALACGVPVLSTDVGGISEHISKEFGMLINPRREDELLNALNYMLDNSDKYNKAVLRSYAVETFSKEVIAKQLYNIYSTVAKNNSN